MHASLDTYPIPAASPPTSDPSAMLKLSQSPTGEKPEDLKVHHQGSNALDPYSQNTTSPPYIPDGFQKPSVDVGAEGLPLESTKLYSFALGFGLCFAIVAAFADRTNISTAIIPMRKTFGWSSTIGGTVMGSFFYGYIATQMIGGYLSDRYGGKWVLLYGLLGWSIFCAITPPFAYWGLGALFVNRIVLGLFEGVAMPACHSMTVTYIPKNFQSSVGACINSAPYAGSLLSGLLSPVIVTHLEWPSVFYVFAALALLWAPFWAMLDVKGRGLNGRSIWLKLGSKSTTKQDAVTNPQLAVVQTTGGGEGGPLNTNAVKKAPVLLQLRRLLAKKQVWAIIIAQYCSNWTFFGLVSWLQSIFVERFKVDIDSLPFVVFFPYVLQGVVGVGSGVLSDYLIYKRGYSLRKVRLTMQFLSMTPSAALLMIGLYFTYTVVQMVAVMTLAMGFQSLCSASMSVNHQDIAPDHGGLVYSIGNTAAVVAGMIGVPVMGVIYDGTKSWDVVFWLLSVHLVLGNIGWQLLAGFTPIDGDIDGPLPSPSTRNEFDSIQLTQSQRPTAATDIDEGNKLFSKSRGPDVIV